MKCSGRGATTILSSLGLQLSLIAAVQIVFSFFTQWYLVSHFGAVSQTDALFAGATLPQVVTVLLIESIIAILVPLLSPVPEQDLPRIGAWLLLLMAGSFTVIVFLLYVAAPSIIAVLVPGFSPEAKQLTVALTRIQMFGVIGGACSAVLATLCQVRGHFRRPLLATLAAVIVSLVLLVWKAPVHGLKMAAWAQVLATVLPPLLLLPFAGRLAKPRMDRELTRRLWSRVRPIIASKFYFMTSVPVDRFLASFLAPGSLVVFDLAGRFYLGVLRILGQGAVVPLVPQLARLAHDNRWAEYRTTYRRQSKLMLGSGLLVTGGVFVGGLIGLQAFGHGFTPHLAGNLSSNDITRICVVLMLMSGILPFQGVVNSLTTAYYAQGDTSTPTKLGVVIFTLGMAMKVTGMWAGGLPGLTLAVTITTAVHCFILTYLLRKRTEKLILADAVRQPEIGTVAPLMVAGVKGAVMVGSGPVKSSAMGTIRTLHAIPDMPVGSYNIFARREASSLASVGVEVETFYLSSRTSPRMLLQLRREFRKAIEKFKPDIIHAHFGTMTALFCVLSTRLPLVITFRGTDLNPDPSISKLRSFVGRTFSRVAAASAARNICVTEGLQRRLWWGKSKAVVMPGSVNMDLFRPIPKDEARVRMGWEQDARIVLFNAGRFPKIKRPDLAHAAVDCAKGRFGNIELVVLDGNTDPEIMPIVYSAADCLLITSDHEGSPTVAREAMACNLPIVSVEVGDVSERIRNDSSSRIVSRDPRDIGAAIADIVAKPRRSNGRAAVMEIAEDRAALQLRNLYEQILEQKRSRRWATAAAAVVRTGEHGGA